MKHPAKVLVAAYLATIAASAGIATSAEITAVQQDLGNVKTSSQVMSAVWLRQPDSYILKVIFDPSKRSVGTKALVVPKPVATTADAVTAGEVRPPSVVEVADALQKLVPANNAGYVPFTMGQPQTPSETMDRSSFFIGNTITELRGLDPFPCGVKVMLADGRTPAPQQPVLPPGVSGRRAEAWLLRADGTYIAPTANNCNAQYKTSPTRTEISVAYAYSIADGAQAVAVAIRIGDDYFIDKLQPLAAATVAQ